MAGKGAAGAAGPGAAGSGAAGSDAAGSSASDAAEAGDVGLPALWLWRHPRPEGAAGRCIGQTDLPVHRRRAKRLAHRIRAAARRHGLPREVWTSPLRRCADVGRWLARWGWRHRIDARLMELNFGAWDGRPWSAIAWAEVQAWEADFSGHAPGDGESLAAMAQRVAQWVIEPGSAALHDPPPPRLLVAHAGVMQLLQRAEAGAPAPSPPPPAMPTPPTPDPGPGAQARQLAERICLGLDAAHWPRPPRYTELRKITPARP